LTTSNVALFTDLEARESHIDKKIDDRKMNRSEGLFAGKPRHQRSGLEVRCDSTRNGFHNKARGAPLHGDSGLCCVTPPGYSKLCFAVLIVQEAQKYSGKSFTALPVGANRNVASARGQERSILQSVAR
jgi:hypothetical protein